ncbi:hypothetical protein F3087_40025 [Nocardia colli]|uniref:Uncharacterized protein n=1 Tax=Nocardia colli TaxID=2545717 RepID=A0A5N0DXR3_9NOCA|nr:hypothetical protein F3087_40025 [Nocardia colli]
MATFLATPADAAPDDAPVKPPPTAPTPSQPGVTTPDPNRPGADQQHPEALQPGVMTPRVAPLPVPGQPRAEYAQPQANESQPSPRPPGAPNRDRPGEQNLPAQQNADPAVPQQQARPRWQSPRVEAAPPAPTVEMTGPHGEFSADIDGGTLLPGVAANTHHFGNAAGYVATIGYHTPMGDGEAGVSVEVADPSAVRITGYTGGPDAERMSTLTIDTTPLNQLRDAAENWIRQQPGGDAALDAAARLLTVPSGQSAPQTIEVAGATIRYGGALETD